MTIFVKWLIFTLKSFCNWWVLSLPIISNSINIVYEIKINILNILGIIKILTYFINNEERRKNNKRKIKDIENIADEEWKEFNKNLNSKKDDKNIRRKGKNKSDSEISEEKFK